MDEKPEAGTLFDTIEKRAAEEREAIRAEAEARAREIEAGARERIQRLKAEGMASLERTLASDAQRLLGEARVKGGREALQMKRRLLEEVFQSAGAEVERCSASPGSDTAFALLAEEAAAAVGQPCTLELRPAEGIVRAASPDGRRQADNSPRARLARAQSILESDVARLLFGRRAQ
jgi:vacuolar-type H+-ATPase subunit E/Vma4